MSESPPSANQSEGARSEDEGARLFHPIDTLIAVGIFIFVGWLWYVSSQFDAVSSLFQDNITPDKFPRVLLTTIVIFALFLPFEHILLKRDGRDIDKNRSRPVKGIAWVTMAALIAIVGAGFYIGTLLMMFAICLVLPILWGERRLKYIVPFAIGFPLFVAFIFQILLGVHFDPGVFNVSFN